MKSKVGFFSSVRTKLSILVVLAVLVTGVAMILIYSPNIKSELESTYQNYLNDLATAYGSVLEDEIENLGTEKALEGERLAVRLDGVGIEGVTSSYVYVVSPEGTMLYHPTPEKIGEPVENEVVKGITTQLQAGLKVENKVVSYVFKGAVKYAAYYVNEDADFILVVTTDEDELMQPINQLNILGIIGLAVSFIVCSILSILFVMILVVNPILKVQKCTEKVANLDFTEDADQEKLSKRKDEIGAMAKSFGVLREQLTGVVVAIRENAKALGVAADALNTSAAETNSTMAQVENAVNDIATGANNQAEETQNATENVVLMGEMIQDSGATVSELEIAAGKVREANENTKVIIADLRKINKESGEYIDIIAKQTEVTNESALKIGEATKIISDIASETNLLSLNASIEAARAGEQGRGFAVVASEIQKLADQSAESARRIEEIVAMLLADSESAVQTMGQVKDIIEKQTDYIVRTDSAFVEIAKGVDESLAGMRVVSGKTQEMDHARVNVVDVVNNLTAIAQENAAATQETSASVVAVADIVTGIAEKANGLNAIATELEEKISRFKL